MHVVTLTFICHCMNFFSLLDLIHMVCYLFRIVFVDTSLFGHVLCNRFQCFTVVCITHKTQMNAKPIERFASICCDFDCPNGHTIFQSIYFTILQSLTDTFLQLFIAPFVLWTNVSAVCTAFGWEKVQIFYHLKVLVMF